MLISHLQHLKSHPYLDHSLVPWTAQHAKTWLERYPLIDAPIAHQRRPRFLLMLLRRIRIHVRDLTPRTSGRDVNVQRGAVRPRQRPDQRARLGAVDAHRLPAVLAPRLVAADDDVGPEALDGQRVLALLLQARVQLLQRCP